MDLGLDLLRSDDILTSSNLFLCPLDLSQIASDESKFHVTTTDSIQLGKAFTAIASGSEVVAQRVSDDVASIQGGADQALQFSVDSYRQVARSSAWLVQTTRKGPGPI